MERRKKVVLNNQTVEGVEVAFEATKEPWSEYTLADGSILKLKTVVTEVVRVEGQYDNEGNPTYVVRSGNVLVVSAPDNLRRGPAMGH